MNLRKFLLEEFFIGFPKPVLHSADDIIGRLWTFLKFSYLKYALYSKSTNAYVGAVNRADVKHNEADLLEIRLLTTSSNEW